MKETILTCIVTLLLCVPSVTVAAEPDNIVGHIEATSENRVIQSAAVGALLLPSRVVGVASPENDRPLSEDGTEESRPAQEQPSATSTRRMTGYRVQVFSDNNTRTAKNEARSKSRNISARFPQYRTYVMYNSPYWRLKVGDFRTRQEADEAAEQIRRAFPAYSKEIRVVRDKVSVN